MNMESTKSESAHAVICVKYAWLSFRSEDLHYSGQEPYGLEGQDAALGRALLSLIKLAGARRLEVEIIQ